ncbi:MAG: AAA family ATPase [Hydrotalea flava]|uniref:ParA family protein n=1 Tax=Hydrotalea flava TaxID=714549 RepID=UPI000AA287C5|nr:AAA family ATPase [Hydrotalea flava]NIM35849.1 AAA family ATPase [Hydrotalea flava]NIM38701.1 AAA family ATPase [Hydrotalea flava]NIN03889.1 AAA family ATPase [Hydrotalea flava]NIN15610.1 AAA family ATPase [Hydrotalea flava]NIO94627.1 AAA family ATPase [Hydrotalea flava]
MRTIAVYNIKGGVGKTTTSINMACLMARMGFSVLIWDLDPQGGTSYFFKSEGANNNRYKRLFENDILIYEVIQTCDTNYIDIISNDSSFGDDALSKGSLLSRLNFANNAVIQSVLDKVNDDYDVCIIDCPPGKFLLHNNVFTAADLLLIPNIPAPLSLHCFEVLQEDLKKFIRADKKVLSFYNMVQIRKNLHRLYLEQSAGSIPTLQQYIPFYSDIENISFSKKSIFHQLKEAKSIQFYEALWDEVCDICNWSAFKTNKGRVIDFPAIHSIAEVAMAD